MVPLLVARMTPCASSSINSNLSFSSNCSTTRRRTLARLSEVVAVSPAVPCGLQAAHDGGKTIFHRALDTAVEVVVAVVQEKSLRQHEHQHRDQQAAAYPAADNVVDCMAVSSFPVGFW